MNRVRCGFWWRTPGSSPGAVCGNEATITVNHPLFGVIPACPDCASYADVPIEAAEADDEDLA